MKKLLIIFAVNIIFLAGLAFSANAQTMMGGFSDSAVDWNKIVEHTLKEEKEGKELWERFQTKEISCAGLTDEQFGVLGEYLMGQMMGNSHPAMNVMMIQMHGEKGEEQIHIVMGKRLSGCDTSVALPIGSGGWTPMMNMMTGAWSSPFTGARGGPFGFNSTQTMMNFGTFGAFGIFGLLFMILWWALIIAALVAVIKWLAHQFRGGESAGKSALDILKERYAKGEIDKKEFEEKKRDLGAH